MANRLQNLVLTAGIFVILLGAASLWRDEMRLDKERAVKLMHHERQAEVEFCQRLPTVFEKFDTDGDGLLFKEDLRNLSLGGGLTGTDKEIADFLYSHCESVGHAVGNYRSGKFSYNVYAVSKLDLKKYVEPQAMEARLKRKFPYEYAPPQ